VIKKPFIAALLIGLLAYGYTAMAGPYLDSAHGNTSYGVKRDVTVLSGYSRGNCSHCHEMHGSVGGSEPTPASGSASPFCLFADNFSGVTTNTYSQSDEFCFYCHTSTGSLQLNGITNNDYSATFGGASPTVTGIMDAFNQTSYHNLYDIKNFASTNLSSFFTSVSNPCIGCHNPHIAKRNKGFVTDPTYTAISRPSAHGELWGDGTGERMSDYYSGHYQAPYYYGSTSTYEPGGTATYDGSNMPDYATFCTDCHNSSNTIYSTTLARNLYLIDWTTPITVDPTTGYETGGDKHGIADATVNINIKDPFASSGLGITIGFVVSCLDCHEPHGSPNVMLIRREVNGGDLAGNISLFYTADWGYLCGRCHKDDSYFGGTAGKFEYIQRRKKYNNLKYLK